MEMFEDVTSTWRKTGDDIETALHRKWGGRSSQGFQGRSIEKGMLLGHLESVGGGGHFTGDWVRGKGIFERFNFDLK